MYINQKRGRSHDAIVRSVRRLLSTIGAIIIQLRFPSGLDDATMSMQGLHKRSDSFVRGVSLIMRECFGLFATSQRDLDDSYHPFVYAYVCVANSLFSCNPIGGAKTIRLSL